MISAITSKVRNHHFPPQFYSSAALIGSGIIAAAAAFINQKNDVDETIKEESSTPVIIPPTERTMKPMDNGNIGSLVSLSWNNPIIKQYNNNCSCESSSLIRYSRQQTINLLRNTSSKVSLKEKYKIDWYNPLGEGGFGEVLKCTDRVTGENFALKSIPKDFTSRAEFQKEIDALLHVRESGSHPNITNLIENFDERSRFYLVMDLIQGSEMFDSLINNGPYSEADAARLIMETASAVAFLHGVGLVHADLKPENLMLSTRDRTNSCIKLVDFGCSEFYKGGNVDWRQVRNQTSTTTAYSPPESFSKSKGPINPSFDMFSLGCIIYIMLTGRHPFDIEGTSTAEELEYRIKNESPPLRNSPVTAHLSDSAIDLIEKLLDKKPRRRMTAMQLLDHPWTQGKTAKTDKIKGSDNRLQGYKKFKSRLESKIFSDWISGASSDAAKKTSLIERAFKSLDTNQKGYVTRRDLSSSLRRKDEHPSDDTNGNDEAPLSLSDFSDLISDNMVTFFYPQGYKIYKEGSKGDSVYFLNSGTVEVSTKSGFKTTLSQGALFGEGALFDSKGRRNATIRCVTPVHVIRISKEYFIKYMNVGDSETSLTLKEQDRARDRDRALKILSIQKNLVERDYFQGDTLFAWGEEGKSLFVVESGVIEIKGETGRHVLNVREGSVCGEHSVVTGQPRNCTAICISDKCKVYEMSARDFNKLSNSSPSMKQSFREIAFRRDLQKAVTKKFGNDFSNNVEDLHKAFDKVDLDKDGVLNLDDIKSLVRSIYPSLSDDDPIFAEVLQTLDIDGNNSIEREEFVKIFRVEE